MNSIYKTYSAEETIKTAKEYAKKLADIKNNSNIIILLNGEIGTGKTTFIKGFTSYWKLDILVTSPSFTLMNEYKNDDITIYHFDLYRLNTAGEIEELGIDEYFKTGNFVLIEWAEKYIFKRYKTINIKIEIGENENERIITFDE